MVARNEKDFPMSSWCQNCKDNLTSLDKYYLIGYYNAWKTTPDAKEAEKMYKMGVADRLGVDSAQ